MHVGVSLFACIRYLFRKLIIIAEKTDGRVCMFVSYHCINFIFLFLAGYCLLRSKLNIETRWVGGYVFYHCINRLLFRYLVVSHHLFRGRPNIEIR